MAPNKYGMFMDHTYLRPTGVNPHDPGTATTSSSVDPKDKGLNLKATTGRTGKTNDACFTKFICNAVGDQYVDPMRRKLQARNESNKAIIGSTPFKAVSPMKTQPGLGTNYGTFTRLEYVPGSSVYTQKTKDQFHAEPRNFYTNPPKRGTFGFNKTTLSERQGHKGVATEYEYQHDPETLAHARRVEEMNKDIAARSSSVPFRPANPPKRGGPGVPSTTISKGRGVVGEYEYILGQDAKPQTDGEAKEVEVPGAVSSSPFKPSNVFSKHIGKFPEYLHDPEEPKMDADRTAKLTESARLAAAGPWKPNMSYKSDMVKSVIKMNV